MATELFSLVGTLGLNTGPFMNGLSDAFGAVTDFIGKVYDDGIKFDREFSGFVAVTSGADEASQEVQDLRKYMLELATDSIFTGDQVAKAAYYMSMAGWDLEETQTGLSGVINLAAASGEDLAQVSDIVTDSLTAFGKEAGDVTDYVNVLAAAAVNSNTDVGKMGQTFKYLAPVAGALGYDYKDMALSIGLLASQGIKASQAGTSLRNIFTRLATNAGATTNNIGALEILTKKLGVEFYDAEGNARPFVNVLAEARDMWKNSDAINDAETIRLVGEAFGENIQNIDQATDSVNSFLEELNAIAYNEDGIAQMYDQKHLADIYKNFGTIFEDLGVNAKTTNGEYKQFVDIIDQVRIATSGLSDEEQISYANRIGNLRGMTAWLALMNASDEDVAELANALWNADDAAESMAKKRLNNLGGDIDMLNSKLNIMNIAIYDDTKEDARTIFTELGTSVDNITEAIKTAGATGGDALIAGIEQAGKEVDRLLNILSPILEPIFVRIGTLFSTSLTTAVDILFGNGDLLPKVLNWGIQLGEGLYTGILHALAISGAVTPQMKGLLKNFLGVNLDDYIDVDPNKITEKVNSELKSGNEIVPDAIMVDVEPVLASADPSMVESWDTSFIQNKTSNSVISGVTTALSSFATGGESNAGNALNAFGELFSAILIDPVQNGVQTGAIEGVSGLANDPAFKQAVRDGVVIDIDENNIMVGSQVISKEDEEKIKNHLAYLGYDCGAEMGANISGQINTNIQGVLMPKFRKHLESVGTSGGRSMAQNVTDQLETKSLTWSDIISGKIGNAGTSAGNSLASGIQGALNAWTFGISIIGSLFGNGQGYAKAMNTGYLLNGATVFGFSRKGDPLIGGEAGQEAVIGTRALTNMITEAVAAGGAGAGNVSINVYQQPGESADALADKIQRILVRRERQRRSSLT